MQEILEVQRPTGYVRRRCLKGFCPEESRQDERSRLVEEVVVSKTTHAAKAVSWRIVGTLDTMLIGWFVTGDPLIGASIGAIEVVTKLGLYYFHERAWYSWSRFGLDDKKRKKVVK